MANTDKPSGLRPIRGPFRANEYTLAAANAIIGKGDLLAIQADGTIDRAAITTTTGVGVALADADASSGGELLVSDHPATIYAMQTDDGTGTLTAQTGINLNANIIVTNATNGVSRMEIDESSGAVTSTLPLKILRLYRAVDNAFGEFNVLECQINNSVLSGGAGAAGL